MTTVFNGASNVAQAGGAACLGDAGWAEMLELVAFYKENAAILRGTFQVSYIENVLTNRPTDMDRPLTNYRITDHHPNN
jgi:LL-diaminopimelate aminotransferase